MSSMSIVPSSIPANLIKSEIGTTLPPSHQSWGSALPLSTEQGTGCSKVFVLILKNIACTVLALEFSGVVQWSRALHVLNKTREILTKENVFFSS